MTEINLGKTLSELRAAKGATQEEVAAALSVSNKTVSKWENGDSSPDISALAELAKYYGVSTDRLLGLKSESRDEAGRIAEEFKGLDRRQASLKLFEILKETIIPCFYAAGAGIKDTGDGADAIPPRTDKAPRSMIAVKELFHFFVCSDDVNLAVVQLQNRSNFGWLAEKEAQEQIAGLLTFLADPDAMKILYFIHSADCAENFTAAYMAKNTSVEYEKTVEILEQCCAVGLCRSETAHLKTGTTEIYESFGDGLTLSILAMAYEKTCGENSYNYCYNGTSKMIRGEKK